MLLCVAVFVGFGWVAYERQSMSGYLNDLRSGWRSTRAQAAYELSKILLADPQALDQEPGAKEELRKIFTEVEDPEIRRYLALVLGYTRDPESVEVLTAALDGADSQTRIYLLWALGTVGDSRALPSLTEALIDEDPASVRRRRSRWESSAIRSRSTGSCRCSRIARPTYAGTPPWR